MTILTQYVYHKIFLSFSVFHHICRSFSQIVTTLLQVLCTQMSFVFFGIFVTYKERRFCFTVILYKKKTTSTTWNFLHLFSEPGELPSPTDPTAYCIPSKGMYICEFFSLLCLYAVGQTWSWQKTANTGNKGTAHIAKRRHVCRKMALIVWRCALKVSVVFVRPCLPCAC